MFKSAASAPSGRSAFIQLFQKYTKQLGILGRFFNKENHVTAINDLLVSLMSRDLNQPIELDEQTQIMALQTNTALPENVRAQIIQCFPDRAFSEIPLSAFKNLAELEAIIVNNPKILNHQFANGKNILMHAIEQVDCSSKVIEQLIKRKPALINETDANGMTPLMYAAKSRNPGLIIAVMGRVKKSKGSAQKSLNMNVQDHQGRTALMHAIESGHELCIKSLLAKQPNLTVTNTASQTAADIAAEKGVSLLKPDQIMSMIVAALSAYLATKNPFLRGVQRFIGSNFFDVNKIDSISSQGTIFNDQAIEALRSGGGEIGRILNGCLTRCKQMLPTASSQNIQDFGALSIAIAASQTPAVPAPTPASADAPADTLEPQPVYGWAKRRKVEREAASAHPRLVSSGLGGAPCATANGTETLVRERSFTGGSGASAGSA